MASTQRMPVPSLSTTSSYGSCRVDAAPPEQFPAGLRVLVVDDDVTCLKILERMLHRCRYRVTTCCQATIALSLVRERKGGYDLVISDVHMPDMDGFKLLELVGLEMDLPVIMMSADGSTSAVMKGIKHGACDYLIKPVRIEELKNIWQHVVRKNLNENKEPEHSGSVEDSDRHTRVIDDADYSSSINGEADVTSRSQKKKRDTNEEDDDGDLDNDDPSASKKPRVVWSVELHQQFVSAVNQLGFDQAVPKRILELMNVPGLTRENVASHLQKFRLYLKRLRGVAEHQSGFSNSFCTLLESNAKVSSLDRTDFQALAASGQIPPQTLAALQAELFGQPSGSLVLPAIDQPILMHASTQGSKCIPIEPEIAFGQPLMKCQSNLSEQLHQSNIAVEDMPSEFSSWSSDHHGTSGSTRNLGGVNTQNDNMLVQMSQQQLYPVLAKSHHVINVQPSCLVSPFLSSDSFQVGNSPFPLMENSRIMPFHSSISFQVGSTTVTTHQNSKCNNSGTVVGYSPLSSASNDVPWGMGQVSDGGFKNVGVLNGFTTPGSLSSLSSCSARTDRSTGWRVHNPTANVGSAGILPGRLPNLCILGSETNKGALPGQEYAGNLGFVGKVTHISSRFAVDDVSPTNKLCHKKTCITDDADRVKQEFHLDSVDGSKFSTTLPCFSANDAVGMQSK